MATVDETVCGFHEWKQGLDKEDISECGRVANRPEEELWRMYERYYEFQTSPYAKRIREGRGNG